MSKGKECLHYLLLFLIVLITMNMIMMCLFIKQGSLQVINKYKKQLKYEVTLTSNNGDVSLTDAKELTHLKGVKAYNYEQLVNASSSLQSVDTRLSFPRIHLKNYQEDYSQIKMRIHPMQLYPTH